MYQLPTSFPRDLIEAARLGRPSALLPGTAMPIRLSVESDDPGYQAWCEMPKKHDVIIMLDGERQVNCVTADSRAGLVKRFRLDEKGRYVASDYGRAVTEIVYGKVEIRREPK